MCKMLGLEFACVSVGLGPSIVTVWHTFDPWLGTSTKKKKMDIVNLTKQTNKNSPGNLKHKTKK